MVIIINLCHFIISFIAVRIKDDSNTYYKFVVLRNVVIRSCKEFNKFCVHIRAKFVFDFNVFLVKL